MHISESKGTSTNDVNHLKGGGGTEKLIEVNAPGERGGFVETKMLTSTTPNILIAILGKLNNSLW